MLVKYGLGIIFKKHRGRAIASMVAISLSIMAFFQIAITVDTASKATRVHENYLYGNIHYSVYREDGFFSNGANNNYTIPREYMNVIRDVHGVKGVISRKDAGMLVVKSSDHLQAYGALVHEIDISNPSEHVMGRGIIIDCMEELGDPDELTLENVLGTKIVPFPVVISNEISIDHGWGTGDEIVIVPENATSLYGTQEEKDSIDNGTASALEMEALLREDYGRMQEFTIVAVFLDGAEGIERPIPKEEASLSGITPAKQCVYLKQDDGMQYVFNSNPFNTGYFLMEVDEKTFDEQLLLQSLEGNPHGIRFSLFNFRKNLDAYVDSTVAQARAMLLLIGLLALMVSMILIRTVVQMNLEDDYKRIGILYAMGHKRSRVWEIVLPQIFVIAGISCVVGMLSGYVIAHNYEFDSIIRMFSENKSYAVTINVEITISLLSTLVTLGLGLFFPFVYGGLPLRKLRKWEIRDLIEPEKISEEMLWQEKIMKKKYKRENDLEKFRATIVGKINEFEKKGKERKIKSLKRALEKREEAYEQFKDKREKTLMESREKWLARIGLKEMELERAMADENEKRVQKLDSDIKLTRERFEKRIIDKEMKMDGIKKMTRKGLKSYNAKKLVVPFMFIVISFIAMYYSGTRMFPDGIFTTDYDDFWIWVGIFFVSCFMFISNVLVVFGIVTTFLTAFFSLLVKKWIGQNIGDYIPKRVFHASKSRNRRNMANGLTIGTTLVIFLVILQASVVGREYDQNRTHLGGDIVVYEPMISIHDMERVINEIAGIKHGTLVTYDIMQSWKFNRNTIASNYIVNKIDGIGGKTRGYDVSFNMVIINDLESFLKMNSPSDVVYDFEKPRWISDGALVRRLGKPGTIIVQDSLATDLGKRVGENVTVQTLGLEFELEIVATTDYFPCCPFMKVLDREDWKMKSRTAITTAGTIIEKMGDFIGDVDIYIKNKDTSYIESQTNETIPDDLLPYTSGKIDKAIVAPVLGSIDGVDSWSFRFSTFAPGVPEVVGSYDPSRVVYKNPNVAVNDNGSVDLKFRMYSFDPLADLNIVGNAGIVSESNDWVNTNALSGFDGTRYYNRTTSEIMYAMDQFFYPSFSERNATLGKSGYVITNRYASVYEDINNLSYVYENKPGDILTITFESNSGMVVQDFVIAATIDTHLAYEHTNGTEEEGYMLSSQSLNYNFDKINDEQASFIEIFDADANVMYISKNEIEYMEFVQFGSPFGIQANEMINHVYVKIASGQDAGSIAKEINDELLKSSASNYSVVPYKDMLLDKIAQHGSIHLDLKKGANETVVLNKLRQWFLDNGYEWRDASVGYMGRFANSDWIMISEAFDMLKLVGIITLIVTQLALSVTIHMMIRRQKLAYGTLKALGFSRRTMTRMTIIETSVPNIASILIGFIIGLTISWIMSISMNSTLLMPFILTIPVLDVIVISIVSFVSTLASAVVNAWYVVNLPVDEILRKT